VKNFVSHPVETNPSPGDTPNVITTKADNQKRVVVPQAKPGQVYAVGEKADGSLTLTVVKPTDAANLRCRLAKEDGFTIAVPGQLINEQAIKELLADFP
jgi:hypothetical protein